MRHIAATTARKGPPPPVEAKPETAHRSIGVIGLHGHAPDVAHASRDAMADQVHPLAKDVPSLVWSAFLKEQQPEVKRRSERALLRTEQEQRQARRTVSL